MNPPSGMRYDITRSYDWNYAHAPASAPAIRVPECPGEWNFCGIPVGSPLGIPAGPLLNSRWILYYAALGFDVLTYKTVRSIARASYPQPNLVPIRQTTLSSDGSSVVASDDVEQDSWAISFGMPSKDPDLWQEDVERARTHLPPGKVLVVSVVASPGDGWTLAQIVADFATCAGLASDAGAHAIEANLSCPNVATEEGQLYTSPEASREIAAAIRTAVPQLPLILKVGLFSNGDVAQAFVRAVSGCASAISTTNTITAGVHRSDGTPLFEGDRRGIGGRAIAARCLQELSTLRDVVDRSASSLRLISVGGVRSAEDVVDRLGAGAHHVQLATAAMLDPNVALTIRGELSRMRRETMAKPAAQ